MIRKLAQLKFRFEYGFACMQASFYSLTPFQRMIVIKMGFFTFFLLAGDGCGDVPTPCAGAACIQHNVSNMTPTQ